MALLFPIFHQRRDADIVANIFGIALCAAIDSVLQDACADAGLQPLSRLRSARVEYTRRQPEIRHAERGLRRIARQLYVARTKVQLHPDARPPVLSASAVTSSCRV